MAALVFIAGSLILLAGFVLLTRYETVRGTRFFAASRSRLDAEMERISFILEHVDFAAFFQDELRALFARLGHASAHASLRSVRATERLLTRVVRHFRTEHSESLAPRGDAREFVKTLSDFKETLKESAPNVPEVR